MASEWRMEAETTVVVVVVTRKKHHKPQSNKRDAYKSCCCRRRDLPRQATEVFEYDCAGIDVPRRKAETCGTRLRTSRCS